MMTIIYEGRNSIYVNMTNRCPCACVFCLRHNKDYVFNSDSLWLDREPTVKEVCDSIDSWDLEKYDEVVFCGYGEPTYRIAEVVELAKYFKSKGKKTGTSVVCRVCDATPAVFSTHAPNRDSLYNITAQFVDSKLDFLFGRKQRNTSDFL